MYLPIRIIYVGLIVSFISGRVLTVITVTIKNVFGPTNTRSRVMSMHNSWQRRSTHSKVTILTTSVNNLYLRPLKYVTRHNFHAH